LREDQAALLELEFHLNAGGLLIEAALPQKSETKPFQRQRRVNMKARGKREAERSASPLV
jgi:hypothetical protein